MNIAVITSGDIPSYWAHSINTIKHAQGFFKLGHNVEILTVEHLLEKLIEKKFQNINNFYGINQQIKIKYFKDKSIFYLQDLRIFKSILTRIKAIIPKLRSIYDPEKKIIEYCVKQKYDIIYCRAYRAPYYGIKNKIPTIIETHTTFIKNPDLQKLLSLSTNRYFKGIVTISGKLKQNFIKEGVPREKIIVLEDAVDFEKFNEINKNKKIQQKDSKQSLGIPLTKTIIMYCGSLKPGKGINKILEIAKFFDHSFCFYLVGGTKRDIKYWKNKAKKGSLSNVYFRGFVINKYIPIYLKVADILIMPYDLNEKNKIMDINTSSPLKLFEYMAAKKPIVSLKIKTINKIVSHEKEALLAKSDDVKKFAKLIRNLIENKDLAQKIAQNAYDKVKNYTYKRRCGNILKEFYSY